MKKYFYLIVFVILLITGCCKENDVNSSQQVTYRLNVSDVGYKMWYHMEDWSGDVNTPGLYDSTVTRYVGDTLYMRVQGECSDDMRQAFNMQILVNGFEVKSKSLTVSNTCYKFDFEMKYILLP